MPAIQLAAFSGLVPRMGPTLLGNTQAQIADNVKLQSGELRSWAQPVSVFQATAETISIFRLKNQTTQEQIWLEWTTDVDVVAGPVADVLDHRIYYTGDGLPKKTNWALATTGTGVYPRTKYNLKVPAPTTAPTLVAAGGSTPAESRSYVYTFLSTFGAVVEESAPSPAKVVPLVNTSGSTVSVSGFATAGITAEGYNITGLRIYRSVVGATAIAYLLVDQIGINPATGIVYPVQTSTNGVAMVASTYPDSYTASTLGTTALPSLSWGAPPDDLKGLVAMPNGMLAGFRNNEVWFSEPYFPHSWPIAYQLTTEYPVVGLGVFGSTLFVGTTKNPYLMSGTHPAAITQEKLALLQPCASKRSIAFDQTGVLYASPNGLVTLSPGGQEVLTTPLYTRDEWDLLAPETMLGLIYNNSYVGFYTDQVTGERTSLVLARGDTPPLTNLDFPATAVFLEPSTGDIFAVSNTDDRIYQLDSDPTNNTVYEWKSKQFVLPRPTNFAVMQVDADFVYMGDAAAINAAAAVVAAANAVLWAAAASNNISLQGDLNASNEVGVGIQVNDLMMNGSKLAPGLVTADIRTITVDVYADYALVFSTGITSLEPLRMPSLKKSYIWEMRFTGNTPLRSFGMATSVAELSLE